MVYSRCPSRAACTTTLELQNGGKIMKSPLLPSRLVSKPFVTHPVSLLDPYLSGRRAYSGNLFTILPAISTTHQLKLLLSNTGTCINLRFPPNFKLIEPKSLKSFQVISCLCKKLRETSVPALKESINSY